MDSVSLQQGLKDLATHFSAPANHRDRDPQHVSESELEQAGAGLSAEARAVIDLVANERGAYDAMRGAVREGRLFGDGQLSLRDLKALANPSEGQRSTVENLRGMATRLETRRAERERAISSIVTNARDVYENHVFQVQLRMARSDLTLDLERHLKNAASAQFQDITVDGHTFAAWHEGQTLSSRFDALNFLIGDSWATYRVTVNRKTQSTEYAWRDANGAAHAVTDPSVVAEAQRRLRAAGRLITVETPDFRASYVLDAPIRREDIASRSPLTRRFVTMEIANHSFSLNLLHHARDAMTSHRIEFEVPPALRGSDEFNTGLNVPSALLGGRLTALTGRVVSQRTQQDESMLELTLRDGRKIIMTRDEAAQRGLT